MTTSGSSDFLVSAAFFARVHQAVDHLKAALITTNADHCRDDAALAMQQLKFALSEPGVPPRRPTAGK